MKTQEHNIKTSKFITELQSEIEELSFKLSQAQERISWWEEQYKLSRARKFGKSSEKIDKQLGFFDEIGPSENNDESLNVATEDAEDQSVSDTRKKKTVGRKIDTSKLLRETCTHDLIDEEKKCVKCGSQMHAIGEDKTKKLIYIPATVKLIEHVYPKYACRSCDTIKMQKREEGPIPKSMATSSLIAEIIISKYERHIPLYRRSEMFARDGIDLPDNTLGNWVMKACDALAPLNDALWEEIKKSQYLQVDETPVKVLNADKKGYMWCYHNPAPDNRYVIYDYHLSRGAEVPKTRLKDFQGLLQTDGYGGYNPLRERDDIINLGCFAHCRRKFCDAQKVSGKKAKGLAAHAVKTIAQLYRIEKKIKTDANDEKEAYRQEHAKPILNKLFSWLIENKSKVLPKSQLGNAFTYALNQWSQLSAYIDHGEANIDNNWVENKIRPFALGRRNWLFVGNERGGKAAALLYSLIQTCQANGINSRSYFNYILNQSAKLRRGEVEAKTLLPQFIDPDLLK